MSYVGIDLGTTNSAIATYDGRQVHLHKGPEHLDVTPSAIYFDARGNRYVGRRAYDQAARTPDRAAVLFKRLMGTNTPIVLSASNVTLSPEEASTIILSTLVGYLPEEIREGPDTGTVITVPAAFNQMQKDATRDAAERANVGKVALMQEPVAAVMGVMHESTIDGMFLIYDLGGGTLDVALAEAVSGRVNLLSHGGITMLGGRDFDRLLFDNVTKPWLLSEFHLPPNLMTDPKYKPLVRLAIWATERAKIELSHRENSLVSLSEEEIRLQDLDGRDLYLEIPIDRNALDRLIEPRIIESVEAAGAAIRDAGLSPYDIGHVVFVGGPTQYKPLRDLVSTSLGIQAFSHVDPMSVVALGAAIFAESIDWSQESRGRKKSRASVAAGRSISFNFPARTPDARARIVVDVDDPADLALSLEVQSLTTGWTSGRMQVAKGRVVEVPLPSQGIHQFRLALFHTDGARSTFTPDPIEVVRTGAVIDAIPASHSIGVEARSKAGGKLVLDYLVRAGDHLPKKGTKKFLAEHSVAAGSPNALNFKLWEGEIDDPISDNNAIGALQVRGTDFDEGIIRPGDELIFDYEVMDSETVRASVTIPTVGAEIKSQANLYIRQDAQINFSNAGDRIKAELDEVETRLERMEEKVSDARLDEARLRLEDAEKADLDGSSAEDAKASFDRIQQARKIIHEVRKDNRIEILLLELDELVEEFNTDVREYAQPTEEASFDNLSRTARRSIENGSPQAEEYLQEMKGRRFQILWRQPWFVQLHFDHFVQRPWLGTGSDDYSELLSEGHAAIERGDYSRLRGVVIELYSAIRSSSSERSETADLIANIVIG